MRRAFLVTTFAALLLGWTGAGIAPAQVDLNFERQRMKQALTLVSREIEKSFHDPSLRGLNWKQLTEQARQRIDQAPNVDAMLAAIFALVEQLDDSHTVFIPPSRPVRIRFGFDAKAFGNEIRLDSVDKDGAAAAAGLRAGDRLLQINGFRAERESFPVMMLFFRLLRPVTEMEIVYSRDGGPPQKTLVQAKVRPERMVDDLTRLDTIYEYIREAQSRAEPFYSGLLPGDIGYLRMPFVPGDRDFIGHRISDVEKARAVIVDLRSNFGGARRGLEHFVNFFETEPQDLVELRWRDKTEKVRTEPARKPLTGPLFILVDSQSASASELFARHFQRTGRAVVIGDRTAGSVTMGRTRVFPIGMQTVALFGAQVAVARVILPGGEELEKRGVTPDIACIPTAEDLREDRDPCLLQALRLARKQLGLPEEASLEELEKLSKKKY